MKMYSYLILSFQCPPVLSGFIIPVPSGIYERNSCVYVGQILPEACVRLLMAVINEYGVSLGIAKFHMTL